MPQTSGWRDAGRPCARRPERIARRAADGPGAALDALALAGRSGHALDPLAKPGAPLMALARRWTPMRPLAGADRQACRRRAAGVTLDAPAPVVDADMPSIPWPGQARRRRAAGVTLDASAPVVDADMPSIPWSSQARRWRPWRDAGHPCAHGRSGHALDPSDQARRAADGPGVRCWTRVSSAAGPDMASALWQDQARR